MSKPEKKRTLVRIQFDHPVTIPGVGISVSHWDDRPDGKWRHFKCEEKGQYIHLTQVGGAENELVFAKSSVIRNYRLVDVPVKD